MLQKAILELWKRREDGEAAAWRQVWEGNAEVPQHRGGFFESIASIRKKARQFLDDAGLLDGHSSGQCDDAVTRRVCVASCPDGTLSTPEGRLLFFEVYAPRRFPSCPTT